MICWECLRKCEIVVTESDVEWKGKVTHEVAVKLTCGCVYETRSTEAEARADLEMLMATKRANHFMALVAAGQAKGFNGTGPVDSALFLMSEIERRVESGELFTPAAGGE